MIQVGGFDPIDDWWLDATGEAQEQASDLAKPTDQDTRIGTAIARQARGAAMSAPGERNRPALSSDEQLSYPRTPETFQAAKRPGNPVEASNG